MKVSDIIRKVCFFISAVLNAILPIVSYSAGGLIPVEVLIGINVCNSLCLLVAERANKIEQTLKQLQDDVKSISSSSTARSMSISAPPMIVSSEPVEPEPPAPDTARNYIRLEPRMNKQTGAIEYFPA